MMKRIVFLLFIVFFAMESQAEIAVKSFRKLENDLTARIDAPKKDQNGDACAIIKVVTTQTGFTWEPDALGIVSVEPKTGEYWLYIPFGAKRLTIKHPFLGILRDYMFPEPIEKASVYEMVLATGKVTTTVEDEITNQWLIINPEPADALIFLNDQFVKSGVYQSKVKPGSYTYRVEAPMYHTEAGKFDVTDSKKEMNVVLKPAFGYISVNSEPEIGARVSIDGKLLDQLTPCCTDAISSGEHMVMVIKEMYQPVSQKVVVSDGKTTPLHVTLPSNYSDLAVIAPANAFIYVDNVQKGAGEWQGRISSGVHTLEARLEGYQTAKQDIDIAVGEKKTITLKPVPRCGSIDVITNPPGADIFINGTPSGNTPNTVNDLLIGTYTILLKKDGYANVSKIVTITEGKSTEINETMTVNSTNQLPPQDQDQATIKASGKTKLITINSTPSGIPLFIDDNLAGKTPYSCRLPYGNHTFRVEYHGRRTEKDVELLPESTSSILLKINGESEIMEKHPITYAKFGIKAGANRTFFDVGTSSYTLDKADDFTGGLLVNLSSGYYAYDKSDITNKYSMQLEVLYSRIGTTSGEDHLFEYINVPLLFKKNLFKHVTIGVGPFAGYMFNSTKEFETTDIKIELSDLRGTFNYGALAAFGIEGSSGLFTDIRYNYSLHQMAKNLPWKFQNVELSIGWKF